MKKSNKGNIAFENLLVFFFIVILFLLIMGYYHRYLNIIKERVALEEINHINSALVVHYVLHGRFPEDIRELVKDRQRLSYRESFFEKRYLEGIKTDKDGYPVDPWGNRYIYDEKNHIIMLKKK